MQKHVKIYDTTLRDGMQSEGISLSLSGKVRLAKKLDQFGIDYIEGGYAASNPKDLEFFHAMRNQKLKRAQVVAFGSTRRANVTAATDPGTQRLLDAGTKVTTIFGKTWLLHVRDVLRTTAEENIEMVRDTVRYLKQNNRQVIFDAEHFYDGYRDNPTAAMDILKAAAEGGADALVLCETRGGMLPHEVYEMTKLVVDAFPLPIGIHCHNDCELAVANSLEAVRAGATHVQGTINGYGERTGNANLCSIIPALILKMDCDCVCKDSLSNLTGLARFTDNLLDVPHNRQAPYVGKSAFAHKAGMHVNAVEKNPLSFEHITPETVGNERRILVSELSGGSNILLKAIELGEELTKSSPEVREVLAQLEKLEQKGYEFEAADASFKLLIKKVLKKHKPFFRLDGFRVIVEKRSADAPCISEATVKLHVNGETAHTVGEGIGPVNALDCALRKALTAFYPEIETVTLTDYYVRILDPKEATAAKTRVVIESTDGADSWGTVGVSENIIEASWEALVDGVEYKLFKERNGE